MDNDFPSLMAGEALGFGPLDLKEGLDSARLGMRLRDMMPRLNLNVMAPEGAMVSHARTGGYQPEVAFGL